MRPIIIAVATLFWPLALSAQTRVSITHPVVGVSQVLWIADEQGLFATHGIDAQILVSDADGPLEDF